MKAQQMRSWVWLVLHLSLLPLLRRPRLQQRQLRTAETARKSVQRAILGSDPLLKKRTA